MPLHDRILCVSGRLSFELVQKAAVAGAPILVGVGAPTSLAVSLAADRGMTLCGFARGGRVNVYTGARSGWPGGLECRRSGRGRHRGRFRRGGREAEGSRLLSGLGGSHLPRGFESHPLRSSP